MSAEQILLCGPAQSAKRPFVTLNVGTRKAKVYQEVPSRSTTIRLFATAKTSAQRRGSWSRGSRRKAPRETGAAVPECGARPAI